MAAQVISFTCFCFWKPFLHYQVLSHNFSQGFYHFNACKTVEEKIAKGDVERDFSDMVQHESTSDVSLFNFWFREKLCLLGFLFYIYRLFRYIRHILIVYHFASLATFFMDLLCLRLFFSFTFLMSLNILEVRERTDCYLYLMKKVFR